MKTMMHERSTAKLFTVLRRFGSLPIFAHARTPLYRNGYALLLSSAVTSVLGVLYWVLAARYYAPEVVGINSAAIAAMTLLSALTRLNMNGALVRFLPCAGRSTARLVHAAYGLSLLAALLVLSGSALLAHWWTLPFLAHATPLLLGWFAVSTLAMNVFVLQDHVLTGLRQTLWIPIENAVYAVAKIVLLVVFAALAPSYGILLSWTVPLLLISVPLNVLIFRRFIPAHVQASNDQELPIVSRTMIGFIASDYVGAMFLMAATTLLPIMVTALAGAAANAYFYLPWTIAGSLQLVATNMTMSLTVESAADQARLRTYARRIVIHTLRLLVPVVLLVVFSAPYLLHIFGRNYAEEGATLLRLFALGTLPNVFVMVYLSIVRVRRQLPQMIALQATLCVVILESSFVLLQSMGTVGVGYAWLASQTLVGGYLVLGPLRPMIWPGSSQRFAAQ